MKSEGPGLTHKAVELVVGLNLGGDGGVVVAPLGAGNHTWAILVAKARQELRESIIHGHLTRLDLWVGRAVEDLFKLGGTDTVLSVNVKFIECLIDDGDAWLGWLSSNSNQKLLVVDEAVLISVEVF